MSKKRHTFAVVAEGDETELYFIDGEQVGESNHDDHGWAGMEAMRDLFQSIADVLDAYVTEKDPRA